MLTKQELRQLQAKELQEELTKASRDLIKARVEHSSQTLKETHMLKALKNHIAVIKTVMNEAPKAKAEPKTETRTIKTTKTATATKKTKTKKTATKAKAPKK